MCSHPLEFLPSSPLLPFGDTMPFKSEAQRKMFLQLVKEGKMSQAVYDKWEAETPNTPLPKKADYKPKGQVRGVRRVKK